MRTIWKYPVQTTDHFTLNIPYGADILGVQIQGNEAYVWADVDTRQNLHLRYFRVFGTGQPIPEDVELDYIGTFQVNGGLLGLLVFHLYEENV